MDAQPHQLNRVVALCDEITNLCVQHRDARSNATASLQKTLAKLKIEVDGAGLGSVDLPRQRPGSAFSKNEISRPPSRLSPIDRYCVTLG